MAGIEKICEYSGEHHGWNMYAFKRNHIQIHPRFRKQFRGAPHTLFITGEEPYFQSKHGGLMAFDPKVKQYFHPPFKTDRDYVDYMRIVMGQRLVKLIDFNLRIDDPRLAGEVKGNYRETTTDLPSLKRRLKRMLRCKKLNIVDLRNPRHSAEATEIAASIMSGKNRSEKEDRESCKKAVDEHRESLIERVQNAVRTGNDDIIKDTIRKQDIHWVALIEALKNDHRIILSESRFRDIIRERFPDRARLLGWL